MTRIILAFAFTILTGTSALAADAQITESEKGVVVEYTGTPEEKQPEPPAVEPPPATKAVEAPPVVAEPTDKTKVVPKSLDDIIHISNFSVIDTDRSYGSTTFSAKFDITNEGPAGSLLADIVAEARSGHELTRILFTQRIGAGESRTFTITSSVSDKLASSIDTWRLDNVRMSYPRY